MKNKSNGWIIILIVALVILLAIIHVITSYTNIYPIYSVKNKTKDGYSVFYEALDELHMPVSISNQQLEELETNNIQIVSSNGVLDIESKEVMHWIEKGGVLVYLSYKLPIDYGVWLREENGIDYYQHGEGLILSLDKEHLTNWTLIDNKDQAYHLYKAIGELNRPIVFNEEHLYSVNIDHSLWYAIPIKYKWAIYQLLIAILGYLYFAGKRFEKIQPLYEETEREEDEYLNAVAYIYQKAKCWDIVLNSYYKYLLKKIHCTHDNWIEYWKKENLPSISKAENLHDYMENLPQKRNVTHYMKIIGNFELLYKIINKRREQVWKSWKKIS